MESLKVQMSVDPSAKVSAEVHGFADSCNICCAKPGRRDFLRGLGAGTLALAAPRLPIMAGPFAPQAFDANIPEDKKLSPQWVKSLFERGAPEVFTGTQLRTIGMPASGVGAGHVYLSGDGSLTDFRGFDALTALDHGFALRLYSGEKMETFPLDQKHFPDLTFRGEYPIAKVEYPHHTLPVHVSLEAFSPFVPLDAEASGEPVTVFHFTLRNTSGEPVEATLLSKLQNVVASERRYSPLGTRTNTIESGPALTLLKCSAEPEPLDPSPPRAAILFEDWSSPSFEGWKVEGTAFGPGPGERAAVEKMLGKLGGESVRIVNSYFNSGTDAPTGKLTSRPFVIDRRFINIWIGGGDLRDKTYVRLLLDGQPAETQTGSRTSKLLLHTFDVRAFQRRQATLEIVDDSADEWGNIGVGRITFADLPGGDGTAFLDRSDYGTMALALVGPPAEAAYAGIAHDFSGEPSRQASSPLANTLIGALGRTVHLAPGQTAEVTFLVTWHFPNLSIDKLGKVGRHYATRHVSAAAVAQSAAQSIAESTRLTRLWRDTWYDSTLPYWFLDRTLVNVSTLATSGCYRFADGRFYAWEGGAACCAGTCTHVWQYAHSAARIFPSIERDTRERVDLKIALHPDTGVMGFRGEFDMRLAVDGQAGTILRFYREHQMAPDATFLKRNWPAIKLTYDPLFKLDPRGEGILNGEQMNTLDRPWYGQISWMSSMYVAACRAGEQMATEAGDPAFATRCRSIAEAGTRNIPARLFNGEYFYNLVDPARLDTVNSGKGSHIDQVYGQSWAFQLGLPRILPEKQTRTALRSLWKHNFSPDAGAYFAARFAERKEGRKFVSVGDAGMILCTFPTPDWDYARASGIGTNAHGFAYYFNETWTGNEYQVASHMLWEGMLLEGMAMVRAIHDRYNPGKRNPFSEYECGSHYARAMASHAAFLAACGFEYHGPRGHIAFAPRLTPDNFRAPFTAAEGWGTYAQTIHAKSMSATLELRHGTLNLQTISLASTHSRVKATLNGRSLSATATADGGRIHIAFANRITIPAGGKLSLEIA